MSEEGVKRSFILLGIDPTLQESNIIIKPNALQKKVFHFLFYFYHYNSFAQNIQEKNMFPNPTSLIKGDNEIPQAEEVGTISLDELHKYNCNADRRILSLFGTLFDVTTSEKGYGKDGACKCIVFDGTRCCIFFGGHNILPKFCVCV
jgi:hypothetical protein